MLVSFKHMPGEHSGIPDADCLLLFDIIHAINVSSIKVQTNPGPEGRVSSCYQLINGNKGETDL